MTGIVGDAEVLSRIPYGYTFLSSFSESSNVIAKQAS